MGVGVDYGNDLGAAKEALLGALLTSLTLRGRAPILAACGSPSRR